MAGSGRARLYLKLCQNVANVLLDSARAEAEDKSNFTVPFTFAKPLHDFAFPWGKPEADKARRVDRYRINCVVYKPIRLGALRENAHGGKGKKSGKVV